jgi:hypothetical protein
MRSGEVDAVDRHAGRHARPTHARFGAGMHVYCEKPIAPPPTKDTRSHATARRSVRCDRFPVRFHTGYARRAVADWASSRQSHRDELVRAGVLDKSPWRDRRWPVAVCYEPGRQVDAMIATGMPSRQAASLLAIARDRRRRDRC